MSIFTSLITSTIGESRGVARLWLEGQKLLRAGVKIGSNYTLRENVSKRRLELNPTVGAAPGFVVSKRERNGVVTPLLEIRSEILRKVFATARKVRVVIRLGCIVVTAIENDARTQERLDRWTTKIVKGEPLAVCSLFHGGGVLDRAIHNGLLRAGVGSFVQVGVELESQYLDASLRNNPMLWTEQSIAICSDIRDIRRGLDIPKCEIVVAGIPCTGASRAGKAKNKLLATEEHQSAGALFVDFLDFVRYANPAVAIIENVPDYLTSTSMMVIRSVLGGLGYKLFECVLRGAEFGALENRERMTVVAYTNGAMTDLVREDIEPVRVKEASLGAVLEDIPHDDKLWKPYAYLVDKAIRDKAVGKGFARQLINADSVSCGCIGRGYAKARSTEPFIQHPVDSSLSRLLTKEEHARVKTIPEEIVAGVSDTIAHEILGQSVIFSAFEALAQAIGRMIWRALDNRGCIAA
ncbi:C-5 cytosine-specific DNA methylase [Pseudomonas caricapapayae]|uniref:C-5 cytosine-specific DNA methylase n=1 Tax=Pseudomonas caricapapayae TaxID=46678 RepID=A0A3M6FEX7_9PSED|nr:DNA cytosine methyltransferase [Pseudomonas caricapapayae]RMV79100.1 C-5 cytosine-specific DNA methylase [Pseudomonas caricapapayae]